MLALDAPPDPYAIFARARSYWSAQTYPAQISYVITVSGNERDREIRNDYEAFASTITGQITVNATSKEEAARPYTPHGATVKVNLRISYAGKAPHAPQADPQGVIGVSKSMNVSKMQQYDLLGVPLLSPTYGFGLSIATLAEHRAAPELPAGLKTIASLSVGSRDYDIRFAGDSTIGGTPCYDLQLRPLHNPGKYRLRELWIAQATYAPLQALIQGNFTEGPSPRLPWLIHFVTANGVTYISDEAAQSPVQYLGHTYTNVTIAFNDVEPVTTPDPLAQLSMFRTSGDVLREP